MTSIRATWQAVLALLVVLLLTGLLLWFAAPARADDLKLYDAKGERHGTLKEDGDDYRIYDSKGEYLGTLKSDGDGGYRHYDATGEYLGEAEEEDE